MAWLETEKKNESKHIWRNGTYLFLFSAYDLFDRKNETTIVYIIQRFPICSKCSDRDHVIDRRECLGSVVRQHQLAMGSHHPSNRNFPTTFLLHVLTRRSVSSSDVLHRGPKVREASLFLQRILLHIYVVWKFDEPRWGMDSKAGSLVKKSHRVSISNCLASDSGSVNDKYPNVVLCEF